MFRRALRLGARVSVASCAAVVPANASCLSDSKSQRIEINDFGAVTARASTGSCISDRDRHRGLLVVEKSSQNGRVLAEIESRGFRGSHH